MSARVSQRMTKTAHRLTAYFGSDAVLRQLPSTEAYDVTTGIRSSPDAVTDIPCSARITSDVVDIPKKENVAGVTIEARVVGLPDNIIPKSGDVLFDGANVSTATSYKVIDVGLKRIGDKTSYWILTLEI